MLYSEIFRSIQGEGVYTGVPTVWLRLFGCNLECNGFGQKDPTDPDSYILPYQEIDLKDIKQVEDLPVFPYGCDSSYSWSKKFAKLQRKGKPDQVAKELFNMMYDNTTHIAFTGGEPLLKAGQKSIVRVITEIEELLNNKITNITFETNTTRPIFEPLRKVISERQDDTEFFFSCSPKIFSTSGEKDRICPDIAQGYWDISTKGQLKFVCNGTDQSWDEIEDVVASFRHSRVDYPIWIMPVGATEESQHDNAAMIAEQTMDRGYNVSARVHCYIWGNQIGT